MMKTLLSVIRNLYSKHKQIVLYLVIGVITTLLNGLAYWVCYDLCRWPNVPSVMIAWLIAVLFAFWANKLIVFSSRSLALVLVFTEMGQFIGFRLGTGLLDIGIMYVTVDCLRWHPLLMKLVSDFVVTVLNFVASKFIIFVGKDKKKAIRDY